MTKPKSSPADRGKAAEKAVEGFLKRWNAANYEADYERLPDARSAMSHVAAAAADFAFFKPGRHGLLEVKETEHDFKLAKAKVTQLPRIKKRHHAGGSCAVLVYHSKIERWRVIHMDFIYANSDKTQWDLTALPLYLTADDAAMSTTWF